jgi:hypothetical protein
MFMSVLEDEIMTEAKDSDTDGQWLQAISDGEQRYRPILSSRTLCWLYIHIKMVL